MKTTAVLADFCTSILKQCAFRHEHDFIFYCIYRVKSKFLLALYDCEHNRIWIAAPSSALLNENEDIFYRNAAHRACLQKIYKQNNKISHSTLQLKKYISTDIKVALSVTEGKSVLHEFI